MAPTTQVLPAWHPEAPLPASEDAGLPSTTGSPQSCQKVGQQCGGSCGSAGNGGLHLAHQPAVPPPGPAGKKKCRASSAPGCHLAPRPPKKPSPSARCSPAPFVLQSLSSFCRDGLQTTRSHFYKLCILEILCFCSFPSFSFTFLDALPNVHEPPFHSAQAPRLHWPSWQGSVWGREASPGGRGVECCGRAAKSSVRTFTKWTRPEWNLYFSSTPPTNLCHVDLTLTHLIQLEMTNFYSATAAAVVGGAPGRLVLSAITVLLCTTPQKCRFSPSQKTAAPQPHFWLCNQKGHEGRTPQPAVLALCGEYT